MRSVIAATAAVLMVCMGLTADEPATQPASTPSVAPLDAVCGLTAEQKQQVAAVDAGMLQAVSEYKAAHAEEIAAAKKAIDDARKAKDAEALAKAQADYAALMAPLGEIARKHYSDLMAVLTAEQKAKWLEHGAVLSMKSIYGPLKLTAQQVEQIRAAYKVLVKDTSLTRAALMTQLAAKVKDDILTAEQKSRYAKATKPGPFGTKRF